jgi:hypothetical protein
MLHHTVLFSALLIIPQVAISSMVRVQPVHKPVLTSMTQTEIHGEGTASVGVGVVGLELTELFKMGLCFIILWSVGDSTVRARHAMNLLGLTAR